MATFSLLVPVYNEEKTIEAILDRLATISRVHEFVVVNDGSADQTGAILKRRLEQGHPRLRLVTHAVNQGKGTAIRSGLAAATSDFVVIQDADTEYDPADLDRIFDALEKRESPVVFGSRFLVSNPTRYPLYLMGNKVLTAFANVIGGGRLTDSYTCYKGMALETWRSLDL
ncbi:MAG: glycosyltransferase family 2 protein, partial [Elusimicrobia bacterium]|nr:glycosyltransferase family 2 protein [Elusimicrobiota bacterium]